MIWKEKPSIEWTKDHLQNTMAEQLEIEVIEIGDNFMTARMPVDKRTVHPYRVLHGGMFCTLAETLGNIAGTCCVDTDKQKVVAIEINANHVRSINKGFVVGTVKPIHIGLTIQVWGIEIRDEQQKLVCVLRYTCEIEVLENKLPNTQI